MKKDPEEEPSEKWKFLEHTADIRLEIYGNTLEELFSNAAEGFTNLVVPGANIKSSIELEIDLEADSLDELLVNWLRELLFQYETKGFVVKDLLISKLTGNNINALVKGGIRSPEDEEDIEIKGVTYHGLSVEKTERGYAARILFDI
jgi:SHS2 domain-containing protein